MRALLVRSLLLSVYTLSPRRILVLDAGRVAEFNTPQSLLKDKKSIFHSMAKDAGIATD